MAFNTSQLAFEPALQNTLQPELLPGESFLWVGQPSRKVIFHASDWTAFPMAIFVAGFSLFWEYGVSGGLGRGGDHAPWFMVFWGIPFIAFGQYLLWGRFFYVAWRKRRTYYALTNKRILVLSNFPSRKLAAAFLHNISTVNLTVRKDGFGSVDFTNPEAPYLRWSRNPYGGGLDLSRLAFFDIPNPREVYQLYQAQAERARASS